MGRNFVSRLAWRVSAPIAAAAVLIGASVALSSGPALAKKCISEAVGAPCKKCHNSPTGGKEECFTPYGTKYKAAGKFPC